MKNIFIVDKQDAVEWVYFTDDPSAGEWVNLSNKRSGARWVYPAPTPADGKWMHIKRIKTIVIDDCWQGLDQDGNEVHFVCPHTLSLTVAPYLPYPRHIVHRSYTLLKLTDGTWAFRFKKEFYIDQGMDSSLISHKDSKYEVVGPITLAECMKYIHEYRLAWKCLHVDDAEVLAAARKTFHLGRFIANSFKRIFGKKMNYRAT